MFVCNLWMKYLKYVYDYLFFFFTMKLGVSCYYFTLFILKLNMRHIFQIITIINADLNNIMYDLIERKSIFKKCKHSAGICVSTILLYAYVLYKYIDG